MTEAAHPQLPPSGAEAALDLAELAWFQVDADRNVVALSPAMARLTGFSADEVVGRPCIALNRCEECLRRCAVFEKGAVHDAPLTLFRSDGAPVAVRKSGRVLRDEAGQAVGAVEVIHPALGATEGGPRHSDALLAALGRVWIEVDGAFRIVAFGDALMAWSGRTRDALVGLPLGALLGPGLFDVEDEFRTALEGGEAREGWRARLTREDGPALPVSVSVGRVETPDACAGPHARYAVMVRPDRSPAEAPVFHGMVSRSPALQRIFRVVELLRENDSTVLVTGESGTGKEMVARAIHETSHRRDGPFIAVNCAAIPGELLESELFGHVRGAFTGAVRDRTGRVELADGGTLFLDEIGDLALSLQGKILRFLQEHTFERVGDSRTRSVDVRIVAATHVNLVQAVSERRFREDLYYRLRVVPLHIPPLRERREDVELLVRAFLDRIGRDRGRALRLAPSASRALLTHDWPGNVRELHAALEYAVAVCEGQTIHVTDLPRELGSVETEGPDAAVVVPSAAAAVHGPGGPDLPPGAAGEEARLILDALARTRYRRGEAARLLGMSRTTLWRRMRDLGL